MSRNRTTTINFPVFNDYKIRVILARNVTETGKRLGVDLSDASAAYVPADKDKPKLCWLVFKEQPSPGDIAHEASHAIRRLFAHAGARLDDEHYAYHLDYLVGRIHKFVDRKTK